MLGNKASLFLFFFSFHDYLFKPNNLISFMKKTFLLLLILILLFALSGCNKTLDPQSVKLVSCLEEKEVKMYGAFWCGHCEDQKKLLGDTESIYVECDARGKNEQAELCIEKGIEGYPTFELGNGTFISGVHSVPELAKITGCNLD